MTEEKKLSVKKQIDLLLELQKISQENRVLQEDIDFLNTELDAEKQKLEIKKNQYEKHFPYLQKIEREYKELEEDIKLTNTRIEASEEAKKKITTIKEFKSINKEIEYLVRESAVKENDLLNKINGLEFKQEKVKHIESQIKELEEAVTLKEKDIETLRNERQELINQKLKERKTIEKKLPPSLIKVFDRIYQNREYKAIVPLVNQVCNGCYIKIPLQDEFEIKKEKEISFCPYCSRIIYVEN